MKVKYYLKSPAAPSTLFPLRPENSRGLFQMDGKSPCSGRSLTPKFACGAPGMRELCIFNALTAAKPGAFRHLLNP